MFFENCKYVPHDLSNKLWKFRAISFIFRGERILFLKMRLWKILRGCQTLKFYKHFILWTLDRDGHFYQNIYKILVFSFAFSQYLLGSNNFILLLSWMNFSEYQQIQWKPPCKIRLFNTRKRTVSGQRSTKCCLGFQKLRLGVKKVREAFAGKAQIYIFWNFHIYFFRWILCNIHRLLCIIEKRISVFPSVISWRPPAIVVCVCFEI